MNLLSLYVVAEKVGTNHMMLYRLTELSLIPFTRVGARMRCIAEQDVDRVREVLTQRGYYNRAKK